MGVVMEDFLTFEMKAMYLKAKENPDMRWTVEIEDETGAATCLKFA